MLHSVEMYAKVAFELVLNLMQTSCKLWWVTIQRIEAESASSVLAAYQQFCRQEEQTGPSLQLDALYTYFVCSYLSLGQSCDGVQSVTPAT